MRVVRRAVSFALAREAVFSLGLRGKMMTVGCRNDDVVNVDFCRTVLFGIWG